MIYFDQSATTQPYKEAIDDARLYLTELYGNPSSVYSLGIKCKEAIEKSRRIIAQTINADPREIYFTSGATEANNWISRIFSNKNIALSNIEHPSLIYPTKNKTYLEVDKDGFLDCEKILQQDTNFDILCISGANNEIGTMQDLNLIGDFCKRENIILYVDATQIYGHCSIDVEKLNIDIMCTSAHKFHGLKGTGFVYIKNGLNLDPIQYGGAQERNMRAGTENVLGIVAMATAARKSVNNIANYQKITLDIRDYIYLNLLNNISGIYLNGTPDFKKRLCGNLNFRIENIRGEVLQSYLAEEGVCISTGSACHSSNKESSYVLKAIGLSEEEANSSIRLSFDETNTIKEAKEVVDKIKHGVSILREYGG